MMGDYDRTVELVDAAYNSAGASQDQFEKTLDSLESKLEQLGNAWTEFTTGILNSDFIKAGTDFLTWVLNLLNDVFGVLGDISPVLQTMVMLFATFKVFKFAQNKLTGLFKGLIDIQEATSSKKISKNAKDGFEGGVKSAAAVVEQTIETAVRQGTAKGMKEGASNIPPAGTSPSGTTPSNNNQPLLPASGTTTPKNSNKFLGSLSSAGNKIKTGATKVTNSVKGAIKSIGGLENAFWIATAAFTGADLVTKAFDNAILTNDEYFSAMQEGASAIEDSIGTIESLLDVVDDQEKTYKSYDKILKSVSRDSDDYRDTLRENNNLVKSLLNDEVGSQLRDSYQIKNGQYILNDNFFVEYERMAQQMIDQASLNQMYIERATSSQESHNIVNEQYGATTDYTDDERETVGTVSNLIGGAAGTAAGIAAGSAIASTVATSATIGSAAGPIGTAVGALIGLIVAAVVSTASNEVGGIIATSGQDVDEARRMGAGLGRAGLNITEEQYQELKDGQSLEVVFEGDPEQLDLLEMTDATYGAGTALEFLKNSAFESAEEINNYTNSLFGEDEQLRSQQYELAYNYGIQQGGMSEEEAEKFASGAENIDPSTWENVINEKAKEIKLEDIDSDIWESLGVKIIDSGIALGEGGEVVKKGTTYDAYMNDAAYLQAQRDVLEEYQTEGHLENAIPVDPVETYLRYGSEEIVSYSDLINEVQSKKMALEEEISNIRIDLAKRSLTDQEIQNRLSEYKTMLNAAGFNLDYFTEGTFDSFSGLDTALSYLDLSTLIDTEKYQKTYGIISEDEKYNNFTDQEKMEIAMYLDQLDMSVGDFFNQFEGKIGLLRDRVNEINVKIKGDENTEPVKENSTAKSFYDIFDNVDIATFVYDAMEEMGNEGAGIFTEIFNNVKYSPELQKKFEELFNQLDLSDIDSINEFADGLVDAGIISEDNVPTIVDNLKQLENAIKSLASISIEEIDTKFKIIKAILSGENWDLELSEDEFNRLNEEQREFFIEVGEGVYKLRSNLKDGELFNLANSLQGELDTNAKETAESLGYADRWNEKKGYFGTKNSDIINAGYDSAFDLVEAIVADKVTDTEIDEAGLKGVLVNFLNRIGYDDVTNDMATSDVMSKADSYYNRDYAKQDENRGLLNYQVANENDTDNLVGYDSQYINQNLNSTLESSAEANGLDAQSLIDYKNNLQEIYQLEPLVAARIAEDNSLMNQGIQDLSSNWETWSNILQEGNTESVEYITTVNSLRSNLSKLTGISEDTAKSFDASFFEKNSKLLQKAAEGDIEAINELREVTAQEIVLQMNLSEDAESDVLNAIDNFVNSAEYDDLVVGAQLDDTGMVDGLNQLLRDGSLTVEQMNSILEGIGWEPEITYAEMPLSEVESFTGNQEQEIMVPRYENGIIVGYDKTTVSAAQKGGISGEQMVRVPIIGSQATKASDLGYNTGIMASYKGNPKNTSNASNKPKSSGGGGGGSSKKENTNKWENPYDEYYNLTEQINELLRQREYLERRYDRILENRKKTGKDLYDNIQAQLASLEQEEKLQEQLLTGRRKQLQNIASEEYIDDEGNRKTYSQLGVTKYARYDMNTNRIVIDWEAIDKITDEEKGAQIEDYISRLEELVDMYEETEDTLDEISDQVEELKNIGRDEYLDIEQRVYDAIVAAEQERIDKFSEAAELISTSNSNIINALQEAIDEERQARQNQETEEDITDQQRRLEYLRRDTSGANDLEILQLQEQIDDAQESYTDSLIDQKISELQKQNDEAYQQRQHQIDLLQNLLDYNTENGAFWKDAHDLITKGIKPNGTIDVNSDMYEYLKDNEGWAAMSQAQRDNWANELLTTVKQALQFLSMSRQLENIGKKSGTITFTNANGQTLKGTVNSKGQVIVSDGKGGTYTYDDVYQDYSGAYRTLESSSDASYTAPASKKPSSGAGSGKAGGYFSKIGTYLKPKAQMPANEVKYLQQGLNAWLNTGLQVDGIYGSKTMAAVKTAQKKLGGLKVDGYWGPKTFAAFKKSPWKSYKTGGLADFTGPAWLDGTKSKPELVLNAQDTKNLVILTDILEDALRNISSSTSTENSGDIYYDIHINVEEIANDYDVEKMAEKIKEEINSEARYRNINAINFLR